LRRGRAAALTTIAALVATNDSGFIGGSEAESRHHVIGAVTADQLRRVECSLSRFGLHHTGLLKLSAPSWYASRISKIAFIEDDKGILKR